MPLRRGFGGLSSGAGGNLFDRPGFFNQAEIDNLTLNANLLLKSASETYGIYLGHGDTSGASANYTATIPALSAAFSEACLAPVCAVVSSALAAAFEAYALPSESLP